MALPYAEISGPHNSAPPRRHSRSVVRTVAHKCPPRGFFKSRDSPPDPHQKTSPRDVIGAALKVAKIATGESRKIDLYGDAVSKAEEYGRAGRANGWDFGSGSRTRRSQRHLIAAVPLTTEVERTSALYRRSAISRSGDLPAERLVGHRSPSGGHTIFAPS
jgi:hypothetical protein